MTKIFESPDKGETIYARVPGESTRELIHESERIKYTRERVQEDIMWHDIRIMAQTDPTMKDLADKMIMTYHLIKDKE